MRPAKCCWVEEDELHDMLYMYMVWKGIICRLRLYKNVVIRSIYMWLFDKKAVFAKFSSFNNCYNARVGVKETVICCKSCLGLQSPTLNFLELIQNNRKVCKHIMGVTWIGYENGILLTISEKHKSMTL